MNSIFQWLWVTAQTNGVEEIATLEVPLWAVVLIGIGSPAVTVFAVVYNQRSGRGLSRAKESQHEASTAEILVNTARMMVEDMESALKDYKERLIKAEKKIERLEGKIEAQESWGTELTVERQRREEAERQVTRLTAQLEERS